MSSEDRGPVEMLAVSFVQYAAAHCSMHDNELLKMRVLLQAKTSEAACIFFSVLRGSGFLVRSSTCGSSSKGMAKMASILLRQTPWRQARSFHSAQHGFRVLARLVTKIRSKIPFFSQRPIQALPPNRQEVGGKLVPLWTRKLMLRNLH